MCAEDAAALYFQKAESARKAILGIQSTGMIALSVGLATLFINSTEEKMFASAVVIVLILVLVCTIYMDLSRTYEEYKSLYVMYYFVREAEEYVGSQDKTIADLTRDDIKQITANTSRDYSFEREPIDGVIRKYLMMIAENN